MDLGGISSYTDYLTKQSTASAKLNDTLTNTDYSNADEDKLLSVCKEFESSGAGIQGNAENRGLP